MQNGQSYTPPDLARIMRVNPSTIKRWIDGGLLNAEKTPGGHRRVSADHLAEFIRKQPALAGKSYIVQQLVRKKHTQSLDWKVYYRLLASHATLNDKNYLEELFVRGVALEDIIGSVIVPTLVHIGENWRKGILSVHEEHRMTFLFRSDVFRLQRMLPKPRDKHAPHAVLACVTNEHHEIPLFLVSLLLQQAGWETVILGINTPPDEAARAAQAYHARLLCLSKVSSKINGAKYLARVLREPIRSSTRIILGGSGWEPSVRKRTKRYAYIGTMQELVHYAKECTRDRRPSIQKKASAR